ncbi:MAG: cytochrome o ubiquinol oxidase subunit III [Pseudomonadota bacterium]
MSSNLLVKPPLDYTGFVDKEKHHDYEGDTLFGFWLYILSDCILFASIFATYAVLRANFVDAPLAVELFDLNYIAMETALLLFSSFTFGMAVLGMYAKSIRSMYAWLAVTFLLGAGFLYLEVMEFIHLSHEGATPGSAGAWSAFYGLIGTHGLHVFAGMLWMIVLVVHFVRDGITQSNSTRLLCLSLFWHFLDIIWICVFSVVYLMEML